MKLLSLLAVIPLCLGVVGCQTYPKNPSMPSFWDGMEEVNKDTPIELSGVRYTVVKFDHKKSNKKANIPASIELPENQSEISANK